MIGHTRPGQQSGGQGCSKSGVGQPQGGHTTREGHPEEGGRERWAGTGQIEWKHSHDIAVGSCDHPGLTDEGTTTEVEAVAVLGPGVRSQG